MNVEMDPVSAIEVQSLVENDGYKVIGWYHSHPKFKTNPSNIDIENQFAYQLGMSKDFIAGIINPCYKDEVELSFFNVKQKVIDEQECRIPLSFDYDIEDKGMDVERLGRQCTYLVENYSSKKGRINPDRKVKQDVSGM
jgi:hypothetical protein